MINAHAPDSGKPAAVRGAFQEKLQIAIEKTRQDDVMVMLGDFNAPMGVKVDGDDEVCGPCGVKHQNAAGRKLKSLAGM